VVSARVGILSIIKVRKVPEIDGVCSAPGANGNVRFGARGNRIGCRAAAGHRETRSFDATRPAACANCRSEIASRMLKGRVGKKKEGRPNPGGAAEQFYWQGALASISRRSGRRRSP